MLLCCIIRSVNLLGRRGGVGVEFELRVVGELFRVFTLLEVYPEQKTEGPSLLLVSRSDEWGAGETGDTVPSFCFYTDSHQLPLPLFPPRINHDDDDDDDGDDCGTVLGGGGGLRFIC